MLLNTTSIPAQLDLESVCCAFGRTTVVNQVDLHMAPGEHVALIGSNGSGKTTLLRAILGLHPPTSGRIMLDEKTAASPASWHRLRKRIAWMPQRQATGHFPLLVRELLASSSAPDIAHAVAEQLGVSSLAWRPLHALSGGQLQRVFLARALGNLAGGAGLLLADEPTAALDFAGQAAIGDVLRQLNASVLVVTHDRSMAARCDRVIEMAGGQLREVRS
jgi:ABC-type Mn2+/Zn2+ transport system ATPase subunit